MKTRFRLDEEDWPDEEEWPEDGEDDDEDGGPEGLEVDGPSFAPMFTGVYDPEGNPVLRHPVVIRMGFYPERSKYYTPTLDAGPYPGAASIVGWVYRSGG